VPHPLRTILVVVQLVHLGHKVFVTAEYDDDQQIHYQCDVHQRQHANDQLATAGTHDVREEVPDFFGKLHQQNHERKRQPKVNRPHQPTAGEKGAFECFFQVPHGRYTVDK